MQQYEGKIYLCLLTMKTIFLNTVMTNEEVRQIYLGDVF
jgi:hypothetical protein